ncbi:MAG: exodeoxyribonuclease VII large subunit [Prevotella sp.]|nr:exodeoxyribonuclease VII large subunit [Prevotella sp.]
MRSEKRLTLLELNSLVRKAIELQLPSEYWVEAELSECRESRGHCYMELVQYQPSSFNKTPIAKASAKCWASRWMLVRPYFERTTGRQLRAGMKVLLKVYPQYHEVYGFSWIVTDIDPTYTLGDMARKRQEIINQLKEEGVFDLQRELTLPMFCLRIAVISSQTAAGYGDFAAQLADSPFAFQTQLYPATMQGEDVEQSVIAALDRINTCADFFDCVVIIRGGGATSDMAGFDTLLLAENVANFPLPIITGIGHDRDESIIDLVSHQQVKTPTAAAAFLIDHAQAVLDNLNTSQDRVTQYARQKLSTFSLQLSTLATAIPRLFSVVKTRQDARINALEQRIPLLLERRITTERHLIELAAEKLKMLDPTLLLKRGYSITTINGRVVSDATRLKPGDQIETRLEKGTIKSTVI